MHCSHCRKRSTETYSRILARLPESDLRDVKRLLQFLVFSEQPLQIGEAVDALAVDSTRKPRFDIKNRTLDQRRSLVAAQASSLQLLDKIGVRTA